MPRDQCAYTRDGGSELYCFKTEGATHQTECTDTTVNIEQIELYMINDKLQSCKTIEKE